MKNQRTIWTTVVCVAFVLVLAGLSVAETAEDDFWQEPGQRRPGPGARETQRDGRMSGRRSFDPDAFYEHYLSWLEESYTDEAAELERLRDESPDTFPRRLRISMQKYGPIYWTSMDNPELAQLMKKDLALKQQRDAILEEINHAAQLQRQELVDELEQVVSERFDVIISMRTLQHQQLERRLRRLQNQLQERQNQLEIWQEQKPQRLQEKLAELLEDDQRPKFEWD